MTSSSIADIKLKNLSIDCGNMIPGFSPAKKSFAAHVPYSTKSVRITAHAFEDDAHILVNGTKLKCGRPSKSIPLAIGKTNIVIEVEAADGRSRRAYQVKIIRRQKSVNWERELEHASWIERDSAGELVFKDRIWIFGGYIPHLIDDVWSSADGISWEKSGEIPTEGEGINIPVNYVHKGKMWITTHKGRFFSSTDGEKWELSNAESPVRNRYAPGGVVFRDRMWLFGGFEAQKKLHNDIWSSENGEKWTRVMEDAPWTPRQLFGNVVVKDGKMWIVGGGFAKYEPFRATRDVWCSEDGVKWEQVTKEAPWEGRIWSSCVVYRNRIFLLGGFRAQPKWENFNDIWYSADGRVWKQLITETTWSARHEVCACVFKNKLWILGGNAWPLMNDVWSLDIPEGMLFVSEPVIEEYVGMLYTYRAEADFNESCLPVSYRMLEGPDWLSLDTATGVIEGMPPCAGDFTITIEAYDGKRDSALQSYTLHVQLPE